MTSPEPHTRAASPEAQAAASFFARRKAVDGYDDRTIVQRRDDVERLADLFPLPSDIEVREIRPGWVLTRQLRIPGAVRDRIVLYLHGGGYTRGSARSHQELAGRLARASRANALLPEYRLAPEHPFPAGLRDVFDVYRHIVDVDHVDPGGLILAGDSAGGGLAVALMVHLRDEGLPLPSCAVLLSPWLDLRTNPQGRLSFEIDPVVTEADMHLSVAAYCGDHSPDEPLISPVLADLRGLPPLLVMVGGREVLLGDALALLGAATAQDVAIEFLHEPELFHAWPLFPSLPESERAVRRAGAFARASTAGLRARSSARQPTR